MNATPAMICAAKKIDYAVSIARSMAGVHYFQDNIVGLNLGQEVLARNFCHHMAEKFHGDYDYCMEKVEKKRFDWSDEDPKDFDECKEAAATMPSDSDKSMAGDIGDPVGSTKPQVYGPAFEEAKYCLAIE